MEKSDRAVEANPVRFSVVVPTFQRRELVLRAVRSLARQEFDDRFEVIVVVDGSMDGTALALQSLDMPVPLAVLEQDNRGSATARNRGAELARGDILMFLDDDMEADPRLLAEHDLSHRAGADAVMGHLPLHPDSPRNFLSAGVGAWAERRLERLTSPGARLTLSDLLTGQLSVSQHAFRSVGGFDTGWTRGGAFGNSDVDFGYRLVLAGFRFAFNPKAVSWQTYAVEPRHNLRQWRGVGRADVRFALKYPDQAEELFALNGARHPINRFFWRPLMACPLLGPLAAETIKMFSLAFVERGIEGPLLTKIFRQARAAQYWRGVHEVGGVPRARPLRVLAYHAITDRLEDSALADYGVPVNVFEAQLALLERAGYHYVDADEFVRFLRGQGGLPRRALLLTFDDCYQDLLDSALPVLEERGIPAVAFAVSGCLGGTNVWTEASDAPPLGIIDVDGLRELANRGVEIGAHSRTHRMFTRLTADELADEIGSSIDDLDAWGLGRPRFLAYPHGESNPAVRRVAELAGLAAAFTVDPALVRPGQNPYLIPRIEIYAPDVGFRLRLKVAIAGRMESLVAGWRTLIFGLRHPARAWKGALRRVSSWSVLPAFVRRRLGVLGER